MRELVELSCGVPRIEDKDSSPFCLSSKPGYLELTSEQTTRLICQEPIEKYYDVEDQPFARGKYATVRRCRERTTGQQFAAKFLRKRRCSTDLRPEILHEVAVLDSCNSCPRIVQLHQVFESPQDMILLLELAHGGELQTLLDRDEVPTEEHVARLLKQVLDGLVFLHTLKVAHLDIKPQNLVLTGEYPNCDAKLCDFGISRFVGQGADVREILGTPDYVAPEVLNYEPISLATDMWSVGVLMYVLLTGCSPFGGDTKQETFCNIAQNKLDFPDDLFEDISDSAKDLMKKLMVKNPSNRLTARECLQHEWFKKFATVNSGASKTAIASRRSINRSSIRNSSNSSCKNSTNSSLSENTDSSTVSHKMSLNSDLGKSINGINNNTLDINVPCLLSDVSLQEKQPNSFKVDKDKTKNGISLEINHTTNDSSENIDENLNHNKSTPKGISSERKRFFMKNMEHLVQRLECDTDDITSIKCKSSLNKNSENEKNLNVGDSVKAVDDKLKVNSLNENNMFVKINSRCDSHSYRLPRTATAMQTMPVSGTTLFGYKFDNSVLSKIGTNFNIYNEIDSDSDSEAAFKFRRVYILDECDDIPSPPLSLHGSLSSNDNSSISDSNSDTISEMSIDSSSDRSSIISLDDSIDLGVYGKSLGQNRYTSCYNVWEAVRNQRPAKGWSRECTGSFERALSRFATMSKSTENLREINFHPHKKLTIFNNHSNSTRNNSSSRKCIGLELMRERNGNVVVIREIKAISGSKYSRCSEVKCESVQSRIRRLQIQNGVRTELAMGRTNHFLIQKY